MNQSIDRLVIAYFGLCESVTKKQLDEDASEDELLEEVLFDSCSSSISGKEQLAFLSICKALFQLPDALFPSEGTERTDSVELERCTLLFVPLEGSKNLVAIVQITKDESSHRKHSLQTVQKAVKAHHTLFCLLEEWGSQDVLLMEPLFS